MSFFGLFGSHCDEGIEYMKKEKYAEAIEFFRGRITQNAADAEVYINLGRCYFKLNRLNETKDCLLQALRYSPTQAHIQEILEITNWRLLCSYRFFNSWPSFSPDGRHLAYVSVRRDTNGEGKINAMDCGGIYILDLETDQENYIVSDDFYNTMPVFSPRGDKLAYFSIRKGPDEKSVNTTANPALYVLDLATGQEKKLIDKNYRSKYLAFTPDGKKIIFSGWRQGDQHSGIYSVDLVTEKIEVLISGFYENTFPVISPLGDKLAFSSWRRDTNGDGVIDVKDNSGIYVRNLVTGDEVTAGSDRYNNTFPCFSPEGTRVAYLSVRRDTNDDGKMNSLDNASIRMYDLSHKKEKEMADDTYFHKFIGFFPDGKRIAFNSNWRRKGKKDSKDFFENKGVYVMDLSSKKVSQLVSDKYYGTRSPVVSPAGNCIAYVSWRRDTNRGLYLAYTNRLPKIDELHQWIQKNL